MGTAAALAISDVLLQVTAAATAAAVAAVVVRLKAGLTRLVIGAAGIGIGIDIKRTVSSGN